jgi:hypothetical protein
MDASNDFIFLKRTSHSWIQQFRGCLILPLFPSLQKYNIQNHYLFFPFQESAQNQPNYYFFSSALGTNYISIHKVTQIEKKKLIHTHIA